MVIMAKNSSTYDFYEALEIIKTGIKLGEVQLITAKEKVGKTHATQEDTRGDSPEGLGTSSVSEPTTDEDTGIPVQDQ